MANVIARVKLAPGETGFFDREANVYLNWGHPVADVIKGAPLKKLRRAVKDKKIVVVAGTLGQGKTFKQILMEAKSKRTGIPLEELMGNTPLAFEPTEVISDIPGEKVPPVDVPKPAEEVPVEPGKAPEGKNPYDPNNQQKEWMMWENEHHPKVMPLKEAPKADTPVELEEVVAETKVSKEKATVKAELKEEPAAEEPAPEEASAEEAPVEEASAEEAPVEEAPIEEAPKKKTTRKKSTKKADAEAEKK
jgi:hypothetical protein